MDDLVYMVFGWGAAQLLWLLVEICIDFIRDHWPRKCTIGAGNYVQIYRTPYTTNREEIQREKAT